jgi:hypothetical protein
MDVNRTMEASIFKPKYRKAIWLIVGAAYAFFTILSMETIGFNSGGIITKLAFIPFVAMVVLFPFLLILTMFKNHPKIIQFGDVVILNRRLFPTVKARYDEIQYEESRRVKIGGIILSFSDIRNQPQLEVLLESLLDKSLISAQPIAGTHGKFNRENGKVLFWSAFAALFIVSTFFTYANMHGYEAITMLLLYLSCEAYLALGIIRGFRE